MLFASNQAKLMELNGSPELMVIRYLKLLWQGKMPMYASSLRDRFHDNSRRASCTLCKLG
jgi:hypothetical protein